MTSRIHASATPRSSVPTPVMEVEVARLGRGRGMASAVAGEKKVVLMVLWVLGVLGVLRGVLGLFLMSDFFSSSFEVLQHQRSMTLGQPGANAPDRPPGTDIRSRHLRMRGGRAVLRLWGVHAPCTQGCCCYHCSVPLLFTAALLLLVFLALP